MDREAELDDIAVVHRVLSGDTTVFRVIVERYGDRVIRFCRSRLGSEEDASDAAQEVFLRAYKGLHGFRLGQSFASWVFAIAANHVRTRKSRDRVERARIERAACAAALEAAPDPSGEAEFHMEAEALRACVAALPDDQREAVELYYFAGLSVSESASILGIGEEAVKTRLYRARHGLRDSLEKGQPKGRSKGILR